MNGRSQQQLSTERRNYINNGTLETDCNRRSEVEATLEIFAFGPFRVIPHARLLECRGLPVPLGSRAFDLLCQGGLRAVQSRLCNVGSVGGGEYPEYAATHSLSLFNREF
jgi:hypothetical protein